MMRIVVFEPRENEAPSSEKEEPPKSDMGVIPAEDRVEEYKQEMEFKDDREFQVDAEPLEEGEFRGDDPLEVSRMLKERNMALLAERAMKENIAFVPAKKSSSNLIKIMSWTTDNHTNWPVGTSIFDECHLPNDWTCENVADRSQYDDSDVIFFHGQGINPQDMPTHRKPRQKWLFYEFETPPQTWIQTTSLDPIRNVFNLTSTITDDSHIPINERKPTCYISKEKVEKNKGNNYAKGKKQNRIAWFVSHCDTQSKREAYARELSKYIPVDIYGKCGNLTCGGKYNRGTCDEDIINPNYKFYLSLENSICDSYVTEKLWRLIFKPITAIPIVLGAVDYNSILPKGTYFDVKDFSSPKMLAEKLKQLDLNDNVFNDIIARKNAIYCWFPGKKTYTQSRYHCQLCEYLHQHRDDISTVNDVVYFWSTEKRCIPAEQYYKGSFDLSAVA